jgi:hypothetical protein
MCPLELLPRNGIGELRFGMSPNQVREVINEPEVYEKWMGGNLNDSLLFHGAILGFDRCDSVGPLPDAKFVEAQLHGREDAAFAGRTLGEWTRDALVEHFKSQGVPFQSDPASGITAPGLGLWFAFGSDGKVTKAGVYQTEVAVV